MHTSVGEVLQVSVQAAVIVYLERDVRRPVQQRQATQPSMRVKPNTLEADICWETDIPTLTLMK
jgi:hypothetical protein